MSFGSKIHHTLYLIVLLITASGVQAGGHLLKSVGCLTLFRSHLFKLLSAVLLTVYVRSKPSLFYLFASGPLK